MKEKEKKNDNRQFNRRLYNMLIAESISKRAKALVTLDIMSNNPVGIGDHSTDDFYKNAMEAIRSLAEADDEIRAADDYFIDRRYNND